MNRPENTGAAEPEDASGICGPLRNLDNAATGNADSDLDGGQAPGDADGAVKPDDSFDCNYLRTQLRLHQRALQLFDDVLIPQATNPALAALLTAQRMTMDAHRSDAEQLAGAEPTTSTGSSGAAGETGGNDVDVTEP